MDPGYRRRFDHHGVRDHRTRRGVEQPSHHHHRAPRRQRLDPVGPEGVHLGRRPGSGGPGGGPHLQGRSGEVRISASRAVHRAHRHPRPVVDEDRHGDRQPRESVPAVPRRGPPARRRARRFRGRRHRAVVRGAEPRAHHGRGQRGRHGPVRHQQGHRVRQDPAGVEDAHRRAPGHCHIRWRRTTSRSNWRS